MVGHRWVVGWVVLALVGCEKTSNDDEGGETSIAPEASSSEDGGSSSQGSSTSEGGSSSEEDGSSSTGEPVDCEGLDEAACAANPACRTSSCTEMHERPETEAGWCSAGPVFTQCLAADAICPAIEVGICSGDTFYMCTGGCVPNGPEWFECDTSAPVDAPACE